jgi:hypothetical protein
MRWIPLVPRIVAFAAGLLGACSGADSNAIRVSEPTREDTGLRVLLVGIDGATFDVLDPLMEAGELPTFRRLIAEGSRAPLRSQDPTRSPAIWTTIATGKDRSEHGIDGFLTADRQRLVTTSDRRTLALWNITSHFGIENGWTGYWVTWPAEAVHGWMLSDRIAQSRFAAWNDGVRSRMASYPPELFEEVAPLLVQPSAPPQNELRALGALDEAEMAELMLFERPIPKHGLSVLKFAYCAQRSYEEMALAMLAGRGQPDLTGVFLIACDAICHTFWHFHRPEDFAGVDSRLAERRGAIVSNIYRHNDGYLARILAVVGDNTVVLVVSDHGFQSSGVAPFESSTERLPADMVPASAAGGALQIAIGQPGRHHLDGILIAAGGPILAGASVEADIFDIAPTILALLGLPIAEDMPGRVLTEIIDPEFLRAHPVRCIDTYESRIERQVEVPTGGLGEEALRDHLRSLGYIDGGGEQER